MTQHELTHDGDAPYFTSPYEVELFHTRYKDPGQDENCWEQVFHRVAATVAHETPVDGLTELDRSALYHEFYAMMAEGRVLPSSPQLWNYGSTRKHNRNGSSCFTGKLGDNLKSFNQAVEDAENVYVASGGFGVLANQARPRGCKISYAKSAAVGVLGRGGPLTSLEAKTGYITNGGRERGAAMFQLSAWHPDAVEFILAKKPTSRGFLDDWPVHARSYFRFPAPPLPLNVLIERFASKWSKDKDWPERNIVYRDLRKIGMTSSDAHDAVKQLLDVGVLVEDDGVLVPHVFDGSMGPEGTWREANRDWDLPLQNCNMSIRIPDALYHAAARDGRWVFAWDSVSASRPDGEYTKPGEQPWVKTDALGTLEEWDDGRTIHVTYSDDAVTCEVRTDEDPAQSARYSMAITTWAGLKANLQPNPNNFKETEYARFYRECILAEIQEYGNGPIMARQVLHLIYKAARGWGDPGVVFEDTYERFNPLDSNEWGVRLSNPCSEYVNPPYGSCNLVSPNLRWAVEQVDSKVIHDDFAPLAQWHIRGLHSEAEWYYLREPDSFNQFLEHVEELARSAYKYIQHAHEYNRTPVALINEYSNKVYRTVGVGVMGLAEALMHFHVVYGSKCAANFAATVMATVYATCWEESIRYASEGWPVPEGWNQERMVDILDARIDYAQKYRLPARLSGRLCSVRNAFAQGVTATNTAVTSVAPTGSLAMIASWMMTRAASNGVLHYKHVNGSVEPNFAWATGRRDNSGTTEIVHDLWLTQEHRSKPWMITASEVNAAEHADIQAAICAFTCMSASKTINLPAKASIHDVAAGYERAWRLGVPGTTIYRDQSKPMQVLTALECPSGECAVVFDRIEEPDSARGSAAL